MALQAHQSEFNEIGYFRIFVTPPGGRRREITFFRGVPTQVSQIQTADPFTDVSLKLNFPQITIFDSVGTGDLDWLVAYADVDVIWENTGVTLYDWKFEGFFISPNYSSSESDTSTNVEVKGALLLLDNYLAAPTFPTRPIPYELLMEQVFDQNKSPAHLAPFEIEWPEVDGVPWDRRVPKAGEDYDKAYRYAYLRPWGVTPGQLWTGFSTRSTGGWENKLTGFVQGLLSVMFEEAGAQWSIRKDDSRKPVLYLREIPKEQDPNILEIAAGAPGVSMDLSRDFSQSANTIYGEGQDDAGTTYSNAKVSVTDKGPFTSYEPFAYQPSVWPVEERDSSGVGNPARNTYLTPKETHIKFPQGMDYADAQSLARAQMNRFTDPGFTGSITLTTDPILASGETFPRLLIKAGRSIRVKGAFGLPNGLLMHITQATSEVDEMSVSLTVDTKYRDQLTIAEVQARTRDALTPLRSLQVGKYSNTVQDLLFPWSYELGSGVIPSGGALDATTFFNKHVGAEDKFPYENVTKRFPPRTHSPYYIRVPRNPARTDSLGSWAPGAETGKQGIPIRMGARGSIRLIQIAAYDADGNVVPVKFHFSIYSEKGVGAQYMPILIGTDAGERSFKYRYLKPPGLPEEQYKVGQYYPFYETAWETVNEEGEEFTEGEFNRYPQNAGLVVGWGNYFEPAGYSPGRFSRGANATGLLEDEAQWTWDVSSLLNKQNVNDNTNNPDYGRLYAMLYCDDMPTTDLYFMGRCFRVEPGGN